jgi:hypothetical protein
VLEGIVMRAQNNRLLELAIDKLACGSPSVIIGVLIRRDSFFREYLSLVYADNDLFRFFVEPQTNRFSEGAHGFQRLAPVICWYKTLEGRRN